jgi:hypothetical protein
VAGAQERAQAGAEISISSPSTKRAPGPSVSSHAAQPREDSSHGTGA